MKEARARLFSWIINEVGSKAEYNRANRLNKILMLLGLSLGGLLALAMFTFIMLALFFDAVACLGDSRILNVVCPN